MTAQWEKEFETWFEVNKSVIDQLPAKRIARMAFSRGRESMREECAKIADKHLSTHGYMVAREIRALKGEGA